MFLVNFLHPCLPKYGVIDPSMLTVCFGKFYSKHCLFTFSINGLTLLNLSLTSRVELLAVWMSWIISSNLFLDMGDDTTIFCTYAVFSHNKVRLGRSTYLVTSKIGIKAFRVSTSLWKLWLPLSFAYFTDSIHMCSRISSVKNFSNKVVSESTIGTFQRFQLNLFSLGC